MVQNTENSLPLPKEVKLYQTVRPFEKHRVNPDGTWQSPVINVAQEGSTIFYAEPVTDVDVHPSIVDPYRVWSIFKPYDLNDADNLSKQIRLLVSTPSFLIESYAIVKGKDNPSLAFEVFPPVRGENDLDLDKYAGADGKDEEGQPRPKHTINVKRVFPVENPLIVSKKDLELIESEFTNYSLK